MNQLVSFALALVVLVLFLALPSLASTPPNSPPPPSSDISTAELAKRYQQYRKEMREGTDEVRAKLRDWRGPMHEVMAQLGERLGSGHHTSKEVIALLGPPDEVISASSRRSGQLFAEGETRLVYWWRGGHDYLYFIVIKDIVVSAKWYRALE
jgi:hypothetical protein